MDTSKNKPTPIATGVFAKTPFAHILIYILERQLQGTLEIQDGKDTLSIYFRSGAPAKVDTTRNTKRLGDILMEMDKLTARQVRDSVEEMKKTGELHGQVLVRMGFVDGATLVAGITDQMTRKMIDGFVMKAGEFAFYEGVNLIKSGSAELVSLDTFTLLMAGVRYHGEAMNMNSTVTSLRGKSFYLPDADSIPRYKFTRKERMLCKKLLESPQDLDMLRKWDAMDNDTIKGVLYTLLVTRTLKVVTSGQVEEIRRSIAPIQFDSTIPPLAKTSYPPEVMEKRQEIQDRAAAISSQNYYEMLGVEKEASTSDIRTSFFRLAKTFHPDRSAKAGFEDLRETLAFLFANLSEAHTTLTDIDLKENYDTSLANGIDTPPPGEAPAETEEEVQVRKTLEAAALFQKAMIVLKQNRLEDAWEMVEKAHANCPKDGEFKAAHAYLQVRMGKADAPGMIRTFREAEKENPNSEKLHLFFAEILKKADKMGEARDQYRKVLEINQHNIEAAREARIIDMRMKKSGRYSKPPGLFSRFKK